MLFVSMIDIDSLKYIIKIYIILKVLSEYENLRRRIC